MSKRIILILTLAAAMRAAAQDTLTLQQCRDMALQYNKEVAASNRQTAYARYMVRSTKGNFLPEITASGTAMYSTASGTLGIPEMQLPVLAVGSDGTPAQTGSFAYFPGTGVDYKLGMIYTAGIALQQPLYMGGKVRAAHRMAVLGRDMATQNERLTATEVLVKTDEAYAAVVRCRELREVARSYHALLQSLMRDVDNARQHGMSDKNAVLKVQVRLNESELSLRRADNALRLATMSLCHCIGLPLTSDIHVSGDMPAVPDHITTQTADVSARPEAAIMQQQTAIARQQVIVERSELLPQVGIRGAYNYLRGIEVGNHTLLDKGAFSLVLNVSLPITHFGRTTNKVRAARMQAQQRELQQESLTEQMLLQLTQAVNNLDEAHMERQLAERALRQAEENMRVSRSHYEAGLETLSDYLEAQLLWQQAYQQQVEAAYSLYLRYVEYRKAAGEE